MVRLIDDVLLGLFVAVLAAAAVFLLVPILMTVLMSFDGRDYLGRFPPPAYSTRWYRALFDPKAGSYEYNPGAVHGKGYFQPLGDEEAVHGRVYTAALGALCVENGYRARFGQ